MRWGFREGIVGAERGRTRGASATGATGAMGRGWGIVYPCEHTVHTGVETSSSLTFCGSEFSFLQGTRRGHGTRVPGGSECEPQPGLLFKLSRAPLTGCVSFLSAPTMSSEKQSPKALEDGPPPPVRINLSAHLFRGFLALSFFWKNVFIIQMALAFYGIGFLVRYVVLDTGCVVGGERDGWWCRYHPHGHRNPAFLVKAEHGAVASEVERCSVVGVQTLKDGGNAVDASISATLCTGVANMFS